MEQLAGVLVAWIELVTDVGRSTKALITSSGNRLFFNQPGRAGFIPGHPMAGKEVSGAAGESGLQRCFRGKGWSGYSPPIPGYSEKEERATRYRRRPHRWAWRWMPVDTRHRLLQVIELKAKRHDELVAWVSHLPPFLSTALTALLQTELGDAPEFSLPSVAALLARDDAAGIKSPIRCGATWLIPTPKLSLPRFMLLNSGSLICVKICVRLSCAKNLSWPTASARARIQQSLNRSSSPGFEWFWGAAVSSQY